MRKFSLDGDYIYSNDIHKSKIIKYKRNYLTTKISVNKINITLNSELKNLNTLDTYLMIEFAFTNDVGGDYNENANVLEF